MSYSWVLTWFHWRSFHLVLDTSFKQLKVAMAGYNCKTPSEVFVFLGYLRVVFPLGNPFRHPLWIKGIKISISLPQVCKLNTCQPYCENTGKEKKNPSKYNRDPVGSSPFSNNYSILHLSARKMGLNKISPILL